MTVTTADPEKDAPASNRPPRPGRTDPEAANAFARASNAFGVDLYSRLRERNGNLAVSPASIEVALAMTWAGARGKTAKQMARVMHLPEDPRGIHGAAAELLGAWNDPDRDTYRLSVVNQLFGDKGTSFEKDFLDLTRRFYGAEVERLDFRQAPDAGRIHINRWVEARTERRIRDLLPGGSIDANTRLVLTNAVYFLGKWAKRFEQEKTRQQPFYAAGGRRVLVPMMHQTHRFRFARLEGLALLEMVYVGDELAMTVLLPNDRDGLFALERRLSVEAIERWIGVMRETRVQVALPRFRIEPSESVELKETLTAMGMPLPFQPAADFTGMSNPSNPDERLYIDNAFHKAFVEVDEAGTEAAAATAVTMRARGAALKPSTPVFRADHPFLFLIRDLRNGSILFFGRVSDPAT